MELISKELGSRFYYKGSQKRNTNPILLAKFIEPSGIISWYACAFSFKKGEFFGYITGMAEMKNNGWGYFTPDELTVNNAYLDTTFIEIPADRIISKYLDELESKLK